MQQGRVSMTRAAIAVALALAAAPALAQNNKGGGTTAGGVITIDQAKADLGGITDADAPGFPVTISRPGSYRLMSNLNVITWFTPAVHITSPGVTLDLNGFEIAGPNTCAGSGATLTCTSQSITGARADGIRVELPAGSPATVVVENGTVRGFSGHGLRAMTSSWTYSAHRVRVTHNGSYGMSSPALVTRSVADRNYAGGIAAAVSAIGNVTSYNRGYGIKDSGIRHHASFLNGAADDQNGYLN